jgi:hypothetical protein
MSEQELSIHEKYNLDDVDRRIMKIILNNPGITNAEVGELVGFTEQGVGKRKNREVFQKAMAEQLMNAGELFKKAQEMAIRRLISFIQGKNEKYAFEASKIFAFPLVQAQVQQLTPQQEETIVFRTRIGPTGEVIRQRSIDGKEDKEDVIEIVEGD